MKKYVKETFRNRSDWLKSRGIGGSSASAILGLSPWSNKLGLYCAIISDEPPEDESGDTESMQYGTQCEKHIREIAKLNLAQDGMRVTGPKAYEMYRRTDKPWMTATVDGTIKDLRTGAKGILEIKTHDVRGRKDLAEWDGKIPDNYFVQVLHYMAVLTDCEFAILVAKLRFYDYSDGRRLSREEIRYYRVERKDPDTARQIAYLEKKETEFWEGNVLPRIMPKVTIGEGGEKRTWNSNSERI